jgi:hypothetical protein
MSTSLGVSRARGSSQQRISVGSYAVIGGNLGYIALKKQTKQKNL